MGRPDPHQTIGAVGNTTGQPELANQVLAQPHAFEHAGLHLSGLVALSQGFMLTGLIWSAISACLIDRQAHAAATWAGIGALLAFFGFIHAGRLTPSGGAVEIGWANGTSWAIGYGLCSLFFGWVHFRTRVDTVTVPPHGDPALERDAEVSRAV